MHWKRIHISLVLFSALFCLVWPLTAQQIVAEEKPALRLSFKRQNNFTYATRADLRYAYQKGKYRLEWRMHHDNLFNSRRDNPLVQFYLSNSLWQHYRLGKKWEFSTWLESDQFLNTGTQRYSVYLGTTYHPTQDISITPLIGYSWDYRSNILDQGFSPGLLLKSRYAWKDGLETRNNIFVRTKYIEPRHQRNISLNSEWAKAFNQDAGISLMFHLGSNEMDDYLSKSVEKIKVDTLAPSLALRYKFLGEIFWESNNELLLTRRIFDYVPYLQGDAEFNQLSFLQTDFYSRQKLSYGGRKWRGFFVYEYRFLNRTYELENSLEMPDREFTRLRDREKQKDYFRKRTNLELNLQYRPGNRHRFALIGTNRYLQYDTPSEENFDDHDELNYGLSTEWRASWNRNFSTRYKILGLVRRYAFLFKERSQDNYTQRSLRLEFDYRWQVTDRLSISGEQYLYVTYNVKDFTDRNFTDRSTRNLESRLELDFRPNRKWDSELSLYRKEVQTSYLNWGQFSETPLDTTTTYIMEHNNRLTIKSPWQNSRLFLDLGYKHFSQFRFQNTSMTSLLNVLTPINLHIRSHQTGAVTGLRLFHRRPATVDLSVWWQIQVQDFKYKELDAFSSITTNYREEVLQQRQVNFRPFLKLDLDVMLGSR
ncbi:MAG: hypothetical protein AAFR61_10950 [Bacteroidota bacterium]